MFTGLIVDHSDKVSGGRMRAVGAGRKIRYFGNRGHPWWWSPRVRGISESEQCSLQTGYWPSLEVSAANYLDILF